ncbi:hypothetical protein [Nocardiopsis sp. CNT312]|uniref:hypothetical protein n=1 Tax=Nocardiopsis sp. CNT312 TaxID=1137268 RepID=UPI00048C8FD1|nr:hypothetical protein [Nocardiopsis sp. CNT312]
MPRLSHTFDLAPVDHGAVVRSVTAAHAVARACGFDGRGWLITPDEAVVDRWEERADRLGLVDRAVARSNRERRRAAAERLREGVEDPAEAEELAIEASTTALQLQSGRHLEPRSHYLVSELSPGGVPVEPVYERQGWTSTGLTITSWDPEGTSALEFAMPDRVGGGTPPVTSGTAAHDAVAGTLALTVKVRLPGRGAWLRSARGSLTIDTTAWYAALTGRTGPAPVRLTAAHALADIEADLSPTTRTDGRWDVTATLRARGRGPFARPLVALAFWAVRGSYRREQRRARKGAAGVTVTSPREQLDRGARAWDRMARGAEEIPDLLHDVARGMAEAARRGA